VPSVIDSLIVQLGLDPSKFKKGAEEADKATKQTQEVVKKSADSMSKSIWNVTTAVGSMIIGFESARGLVDFLGHLNFAQATLSRLSQNFGISARSLDVWDKKIQLAGGSVQGAQGAVNQLNHDLVALMTMGEASPLVKYLQSLGIHLTDIVGGKEQARSATAIYEDLFNVLGKQPRAQAYQFATSMGVSPDILQYGLRPANERAGIDAEARRLTRTTDANAKMADDLRERWVAIKQTIEGIGVVLLEKITPEIEKLLPTIERLGNEFADWLSGLKPQTFRQFFSELKSDLDSVTTKLQHVRDAIEAIQYSWHHNILTETGEALGGAAWKATHPKEWGIVSLVHRIMNAPESKKATQFSPAFQAATAKYQLPPGLLASVAERESGFDPGVVSSAGAVGLMQLLPKYFPGAGKDANRDIDTAARYLRQLYDQFGNWSTALAAYNEGPTRLANSNLVPVPGARAYAQSISDSVSAGRYSGKIDRSGAAVVNKVDVHQVTINTRADNGKQVAIDFMAAMKKRDWISQADSGIQ
jgi:Transglycosylase SLT domain